MFSIADPRTDEYEYESGTRFLRKNNLTSDLENVITED
jgi:hypothetical protein